MWDIHGVGGPASRILILRAAGTSVLLSLLFVVVYGGTNWLTAQRPGADVQTWYFAWELTIIPYVPLLDRAVHVDGRLLLHGHVPVPR